MVNITGERKKKITTRIAREFVDYNYDCASAVPNLSFAIEEAMRHERQEVPWAIQKAGYARMIALSPMEMTNADEYDFVHDTYTIRFNCYSRPTSEAMTAWDNFTEGKVFDGDAIAFYKALNDYGELYAEALATALKVGSADGRTLENRVFNVLQLAGSEEPFTVWRDSEFKGFSQRFRNWNEMKVICRKYGGLDSMLEAYEAGVPVADIIG